MYLMHLTIDSNQPLNRPAISEALSAYETLEYVTGSWFVKTNDPTSTVFEKLRHAVGSAPLCLFAFKTDALIGGVWPENVRAFLGTAATQAA